MLPTPLGWLVGYDWLDNAPLLPTPMEWNGRVLFQPYPMPTINDDMLLIQTTLQGAPPGFESFPALPPFPVQE